MSYTPTNWQSHDKVTSAKLNKIEQGVAEASDNVLTFVATPVFDTASLVSYETDKSLGDIYQHADNGGTLQCFIEGFYGGTINTVVVSNDSYQGNSAIHVIPILSHPYDDVREFYIVSNSGEYTVFLGYYTKYLIPSLWGDVLPYRVPMIDGVDNSAPFNTVNNYIDFGDTLSSLIYGTLQQALQSGTATLATQITDSETVELAGVIAGQVEQMARNGRGSYCRHIVGVWDVIGTMASAYKDEDNNFVSVTNSLNVADIYLPDGQLTQFNSYTGYITMCVHYDTATSQADSLSVLVHFDWHSATIV